MLGLTGIWELRPDCYSGSDNWRLVGAVRKVEFKLLQLGLVFVIESGDGGYMLNLTKVNSSISISYQIVSRCDPFRVLSYRGIRLRSASLRYLRYKHTIRPRVPSRDAQPSS